MRSAARAQQLVRGLVGGGSGARLGLAPPRPPSRSSRSSRGSHAMHSRPIVHAAAQPRLSLGGDDAPQAPPAPTSFTTSASAPLLAQRGARAAAAAGSADSPPTAAPAGAPAAPPPAAPTAGAPPPPSPWPLVVALCALGIAVAYADRSNISVAVISMSSELNWSRSFEGAVLASFFAGYAATQLLGGQLADRVGGQAVLAVGLGAWSLATFATPAAAAAGAAPLICARVALGLGEGVAFPAVHSIIAAAVPPDRRSTCVAAVTAASYAGAAAAFWVVPHIIEAYGWPTSFHAFGAAALLWLPLWLPLRVARRRPPPDAGGGGAAAAAAASGGQSLLASIAALGPLLRRREVGAILVAQYCGSYGLYGLLSWLPTYFSDAYGVPLASLPALTAAPYVLQAAVGLAAGTYADQRLAAGESPRAVRVRLQTLGSLLPAAALLLAASPLAAGSQTIGAALVDAGLAASALTLGGVSASHLDVAPRHAGAVFGAGNTAATLAGLAAAPLTGWVLDATGGSWAAVFALIASHYVVGAAAFAAWAGGDQPLEEDGAA